MYLYKLLLVHFCIDFSLQTSSEGPPNGPVFTFEVNFKAFFKIPDKVSLLPPIEDLRTRTEDLTLGASVSYPLV